MPRVEAPAGVVLPGAYERLLRQDCERLTAADPRQMLYDPAGYERNRVGAAQAAGDLLEQRLADPEPLLVDRWRLGGRTVPAPPELRERLRQARRWFVTPDDRLVPAEFSHPNIPPQPA